MKGISFFRHVNNHLNPYRWALSLVVSIVISLLFAGFTLHNKLNSDKELVEALSPYMATLVESSDRPEMMRVIESISEVKQSELVVVRNNSVLATTRMPDELDREFVKPIAKFELMGAIFSGKDIITKKEIKRPAYPSMNTFIYVYSPIRSTLLASSGILIAVFLISILISFLSGYQMRIAIKRSLKPMDQLHAEIRGLAFEAEIETNPIHIKELEEIRRTVNRTKLDLANAKDKLAEAKARKLSGESYKRLIHDLHNPVAALRVNSKIANDQTLDEETRSEASSNIPRIADQILNQVTAAKRNLEEEPVALRELNLFECVDESVKQVQSLSPKKSLILDNALKTLNVPHDPDLLKRAIINLLENGVEAASSTVRVSLHQDKSTASIKVCDDGPGMDEMLLSIFLQGRGQSGKANRQAFGLSSTNHIVRSHGGKLIYRKSDLGGSSFEIRLGVV